MIAVIADDLTGAAELGAVGWRHGLRAEVVLADSDSHLQPIGGRTAAEAGTPSLVCVDTDSRSCPAAEAERRVVAAAKALLTAGADWIYKKVDSVLRGHVVVEIAAVMREAGAPVALLVPANPALGRVIRNGHYFIKGQPLDETEFARDPSHPRRSSNVLRLLESGGRVGLQSCRLGDALPTSGIAVGDVDNRSDLDDWVLQRRPGMLLAGGAEFFGAVLAAQGFKDRLPDANDVSAAISGWKPALRSQAGRPELQRALFVCGSTSEACLEFSERARTLGVPVFGLPAKLARGESCSSEELLGTARAVASSIATSGQAVLAVGLPLVTNRIHARRLAGYLVQIAAAVLRQTSVGHVLVEGGATAVELGRCMGWSRLRIERELSPGVATLRPRSDGSLLLTVKPGSYAWPAEMLSSVAQGVNALPKGMVSS